MVWTRERLQRTRPWSTWT